MTMTTSRKDCWKLTGIYQNGRYPKAEELLSELLNTTNDGCFVASYNLGLVKELMGKYKPGKTALRPLRIPGTGTQRNRKLRGNKDQ